MPSYSTTAESPLYVVSNIPVISTLKNFVVHESQLTIGETLHLSYINCKSEIKLGCVEVLK